MVSYTTGVCTSQDPGAARIICCPIVEPFPPWECIGCQPNCCFFFGIDLDAVCWSGMLSIEVFGVIPMTIRVADVQWNATCRGWANAQRTATKTRTTRHGQTRANFNHYFDSLSYLSSALPVQHLYHDMRGFALHRIEPHSCIFYCSNKQPQLRSKTQRVNAQSLQATTGTVMPWVTSQTPPGKKSFVRKNWVYGIPKIDWKILIFPIYTAKWFPTWPGVASSEHSQQPMVEEPSLSADLKAFGTLKFSTPVTATRMAGLACVGGNKRLDIPRYIPCYIRTIILDIPLYTKDVLLWASPSPVTSCALKELGVSTPKGSSSVFCCSKKSWDISNWEHENPWIQWVWLFTMGFLWFPNRCVKPMAFPQARIVAVKAATSAARRKWSICKSSKHQGHSCRGTKKIHSESFPKIWFNMIQLDSAIKNCKKMWLIEVNLISASGLFCATSHWSTSKLCHSSSFLLQAANTAVPATSTELFSAVLVLSHTWRQIEPQNWLVNMIALDQTKPPNTATMTSRYFKCIKYI